MADEFNIAALISAVVASPKARAATPRAAKSPAKPAAATPSPRFHISPTERPVALCSVILTQHCQCCGGTTESIGGQFVRIEVRGAMPSWRLVSASASALGFDASNLRTEIEHTSRSVAFCPDCLRAGLSIDTFANLADANGWAFQLPLWKQ